MAVSNTTISVVLWNEPAWLPRYNPNGRAVLEESGTRYVRPGPIFVSLSLLPGHGYEKANNALLREF